jgi:hypothetical protein
MKIYFESERGCGIREVKDLDSGARELRAELGYADEVKCYRKAEKADIEWVSAMGGRTS